MSGQIKVSAYGNNGPLTEIMHYNINGQKIFETIDIDLNSPTYGQSVKVEAKQNGILSRRTEVSPNSELGLAIVHDENSNRQTAYLNEMQFIGGKAENAGFGSVHNAALENSGMYSKATGDTPFDDVELPAVEYTIEPSGGTDTGVVEPEQSLVDGVDEENAMKNDRLQYPVDAEYTNRNGQDHIFIEQFAYVPSRKGIDQGLGDVVTKGLRRGSNLVDPDTRKTDPKGRVLLPMPNKLLASNGVSWGEGRANALEAGAFFAADGAIGEIIKGTKNIGDVLSKATSGGLDLLQKVKDGGDGDIGQVLSATLAKLALSKAGINVDPAQFITRSTGRAINPNLELLFNGPKLRNFTFGFQFAPNNEGEAIEVRKIMRFFKQGMLPQGGARGGNNIFLGSPNVFRIKYRSGTQRIKSLNMFKVCALTAVEFDYTPDNVYQSYDDPNAISQPIRTSMALSFTELTPILESDYSALDKSESVRDLSATRLSDSTEDRNGNVPNMSEDDVGY